MDGKNVVILVNVVFIRRIIFDIVLDKVNRWFYFLDESNNFVKYFDFVSYKVYLFFFGNFYRLVGFILFNGIFYWIGVGVG